MFSVGDIVDIDINNISATEGTVISTNTADSERYPLVVEFKEHGLLKTARLTLTGHLWVNNDSPCVTQQTTVAFEL